MTCDDDERQLRQQDVTDRYLVKRAKAARRKYGKAITRPWIGNAGGAVVTISYLRSAGAVAHRSPIPFGFFLIGLVFLGAGMLLDLISEWKALRDNQQATRLLGFRSGFAESPLQTAGSTMRNALTAVLTAIAFLGGCAAGLVTIFRGGIC
jgi:hypothetical protein